MYIVYQQQEDATLSLVASVIVSSFTLPALLCTSLTRRHHLMVMWPHAELRRTQGATLNVAPCIRRPLFRSPTPGLWRGGRRGRRRSRSRRSTRAVQGQRRDPGRGGGGAVASSCPRLGSGSQRRRSVVGALRWRRQRQWPRVATVHALGRGAVAVASSGT